MIQAVVCIMAWQVHRTKEHLERPGTWRSQRGNSGTILGNVQNPADFPLSKFHISQYLQYTEPSKTIHYWLTGTIMAGGLQYRMIVCGGFGILQNSGLRFQRLSETWRQNQSWNRNRRQGRPLCGAVQCRDIPPVHYLYTIYTESVL